MKSVTINDVARHAGVSKKTVSRVINKEANVRKETQEKVQLAIDALGFKRSPLGVALANNRSYSIALLSENENSGYLMKLQKGILQGCTEQQMGLFLYNCTYRSPTLVADVQQIIDNSFVDGFILAPPICDQQEVLDLLTVKQIPYIRIGPKDESHGEFVGFNAVKAAFDMTNYLIENNHHDIAFVLGHPDQESSHRCERGYRNALKAANIEVNEQYVIQGDYTYESGIAAFDQLMQLEKPPTAIFASNDEMALGALYQAQKNNMKIPAQLSICGIDDITTTQKVWPNLTTMHHPILDIGYQAASLLIRRLKHKNHTNLIDGDDSPHIIDCEIVVRESTQALK